MHVYKKLQDSKLPLEVFLASSKDSVHASKYYFVREVASTEDTMLTIARSKDVAIALSLIIPSLPELPAVGTSPSCPVAIGNLHGRARR